jgi:hypothetical protein
MSSIIKIKENIEWLDKYYLELRDNGYYEEGLKILAILNMEKSRLSLYEEEEV